MSLAGEVGQERDRAAAVCQKEQAKPSHPEQTAGRNEETRHTKGGEKSATNTFSTACGSIAICGGENEFDKIPV